MQTIEPKQVTPKPEAADERLLSRPLPAWVNVPNFLWLSGAFLALFAIGYLLVARPTLIRSWEAGEIFTAVPEKNDYRIYGVETDPAGNRFHWTQPDALLIVPANNHTNRPIKVTIRARGASAAGAPAVPTQVTANGVQIGEINPTPGFAEFQDFIFIFTPAYRDDHRIYLRFTTPAYRPAGDARSNAGLGFMLQSYSVDLTETWSAAARSGRAELVWLIPLLALLALVVKVVHLRFVPTNPILGYVALLLALGTAVAAGLRFFLLARVGWNGEINHLFYWWSIGLTLYLVVFFGWLAFAGWSFGAAGTHSLLTGLAAATRGWREKHPDLTAFLTIFGFNLLLSLIFKGKVAIETGSVDMLARYWDGPEYIVIANNFYDPREPLLQLSDFGEHSRYYWAAHFPGFSVAIMLFKPLFGWVWSPLIVQFLAAVGFAFFFYKLVREFGYSEHPVWLALVALVLPVRWLIYHNVGGSEPLFMFFFILAIYEFKKDRYWLAGLAGFAAVFTRPPGMFLWGGFMLFLAFEAAVRMWNEQGLSLPALLRNFRWRAFFPLLLMPLGLAAVFGIYWWRYGDFLTYFKIEEQVRHVYPLPFPTLIDARFNAPALILTYILAFAGLIALWRQRRYDIFMFALTSFAYTLVLMHSDVLRYSIPFFAILVLLPFSRYASGKAARWLAIPVLLMLFFYSWGVLDTNLMQLEEYRKMLDILGVR
jgi:hypothetical protein